MSYVTHILKDSLVMVLYLFDVEPFSDFTHLRHVSGKLTSTQSSYSLCADQTCLDAWFWILRSAHAGHTPLALNHKILPRATPFT